MDNSVDVRAYVVSLVHEWLESEEIVGKCRNELNIAVSMDQIELRRREFDEEVSEQRSEWREFIDDLNQSVEERSYETDDDHYIFYKAAVDSDWAKIRKRFRIPILLIDKLFYHFSRYGKNRTQQQIIDEFWLKPEAWNLIKSRLSLTKFSNVLSPISLERAEANGGTEAVEEKLIDATHEAITDKYKARLVNTYEKQFNKIAKDAMSKVLNQEHVLEQLHAAVQLHEPRTIDFAIQPAENNDEKIVAFWDLHIGRTTDATEERVSVMLDNLKNSPEWIITLINLWDNREWVMMWSQIMHDWQQLEMDLIGSQQMLRSIDILENLIIELARAGKTVKYHWVVHSNHDRVNKSDDSDPEHILAIAFNEILKRWLRNVVSEFTYHRERVKSFQESWMNFIISHWDLWFDKKKAEQILMMYWEYGVHNICLSWHLHQAKLEEWTRYTRISVPSMNGGNTYSREQIISESAPGYVEIKKNRAGTADVLLRRL